MPQIIIKGMKIADVQKISKSMLDELEVIIACPREYFTLETVDATYIVDGEIVEKDPLIQVNWFDRGQEVQDQTATAITKHVAAAGYKDIDIFFITLERKNYYENGIHF